MYGGTRPRRHQGHDRGQRWSSRLIADPRQHRAQFADALHAALIDWHLLRSDTDPLVTTMAIELGDHVPELSHRAGPSRDRAVFAEGERALTKYLETYAEPTG